MRSTVARRLSTLCRFYRYCHLDGRLALNPVANARRLKVDPESRHWAGTAPSAAPQPPMIAPGLVASTVPIAPPRRCSHPSMNRASWICARQPELSVP